MNEEKRQDLNFALVLIFALTFLGTNARKRDFFNTKTRRHKGTKFFVSRKARKGANTLGNKE